MVKKERRNSFYIPSLPPLASKQPTARPPLPAGAHFLENVNLNGNLLDIPDPPSPPKRNARRQSLPLLRPLPLHDRTNEETSDASVICNNNGNEPATTTASSAAGGGVTTNKRSRKSLCHVPSPVMESNHDDGMNPAEESQEPVSSSLICFDDNDDISSSKRQKRRESMILPSNMAPMKQEDFSKDSIMNDTTSSESSTNQAKMEHDDSTMATNKRRLSIVLPSDIASFQQQVTNKLLECTVETNDVDTFQQDDDKTPRMATRRQSMMLPTDALVLQDKEAKEYFQELHTVQTKDGNQKSLASEDKEATDLVELEATGITSTEETAASNNTETATKVSSFNHITSLVREYCSLPQSQRHDSQQAQEIEHLTGYALIPPAAKRQQAMPPNLMNTETDTFVSSQLAKRELLLKLGDMVDVMDKRKTQDTTQLEETTKCRVERSRNGKYRYYDIVTNRKVRPSEYQELYLVAIQQTRAQMVKRIQEWLRENETMSEQEEEEEQCEKLSALIQSSTQQQDPYEQSIREQEEMAASESDMEESPASESPESMDSDRQIDSSSLGQVTVEQARDETKDTSCMEEGDTSMLSVEEDVPIDQDEPRAVSDSSLNDVDTNESSELLLPFPSRQDTSDDPEIAAAEERLWSEIDQALERYSRQVVAIRQARALEQNDAL